MVDVFEYLDYREFLRDYYSEKKRITPCFSYKYIANKAGLKSKSFFHEVVTGKKNLSRNTIFSIGKALELGPKSFAYFEQLVAFNQAADHKQKDHFFHQLIGYNKRSKSTLFNTEQYEVLSHWYHMTIREIAASVPFKENYTLLGKMVQPSISAFKARQSVQLLLKHGLLRRPKGSPLYEQTNTLVTTGDEVSSLAAHNFHLQNLSLAAAAIDTVSRQDRDISSLVLGLSTEGFAEIKEEVQKFRKRLLELSEKSKKIKRVYHVNFQLIPTSRELDNAGE